MSGGMVVAGRPADPREYDPKRLAMWNAIAAEFERVGQLFRSPLDSDHAEALCASCAVRVLVSQALIARLSEVDATFTIRCLICATD